MLSLELGTLCKRYPDVSHEQILCLLLLRADLPRWGTKQQIDIAMLYHVESFKLLYFNNPSSCHVIIFLFRNEAKQLTSEFVAEGGTANRTLHARSILSQVSRNIVLQMIHLSEASVFL